MGASEKIKIKVLKETVIQGYNKDFKIVLTQSKQTYKGVSIYKVFSEIKYGRELFDIVETHVTFSRQKSDNYFSKLECRYPESRLTRKIF